GYITRTHHDKSYKCRHKFCNEERRGAHLLLPGACTVCPLDARFSGDAFDESGRVAALWQSNLERPVMALTKGYTLFGKAVAREGSDVGFFLMGGPSNAAIKACISEGIRMIDVRHEQAAAMMAHAYARVRARPSFCIAASGPGTINLTTGLAHALVDCAPLVAFGGASPVGQYARGSFQEIDQLAIMKPVTKFAERVYDAARIPEYVARAF